MPKALSMDNPSIASIYRCTAIERAGSFILTGSPKELPAVSIKAAVSPIALPADKMTPVIMPGKAAGMITFCMVCHLPAPKAKLFSRYSGGTLKIAACAVRQMVGKSIIAKVRQPESSDQPKLRNITNKIKTLISTMTRIKRAA